MADKAPPTLSGSDGNSEVTHDSGSRLRTPMDRDALLRALRQFREADATEQRETWDVLRTALGPERVISSRRLIDS